MTSLVERGSQLLADAVLMLSVRLSTLHSILLWTITYIFSLALMYLFHSPFRAHTACRTDWYAQLTKIMQIWLTIVLLIFHVAPQFFAAAAAGHASPGGAANTIVGDEGGVAFVFFPVFTSLNMLFLFLHKIKRRWKMGVTYGPSFTIVLLNSILLCLFTLVHYTACGEINEVLQEKKRQHKDATKVNATATTTSSSAYRLSEAGLMAAATAALSLGCPTQNVFTHPFLTISHLLLVNVLFIICDYRYKALRGFDPTRGMLFAELYDLRKKAEAVASLEAAAVRTRYSSSGRRGDVDRKRGKPSVTGSRSHDPRKSKATTAAVAADTYSPPHTRKPLSSWWWSWWWWHLTRNEAKLREAYRAYDFRYAEPQPTRATAPSAAAWSLTSRQRQRHQRLNAHTTTNTTNNSTTVRLGAGNSEGWSSTFASSMASTFNDAREDRARKVSFPPTAVEIADLKGSQHPDNKTGMVPWFSTFILNTTWQTVAYGALEFLVFDLRILQEARQPKVFVLQFSPKLSKLRAARQQRCISGCGGGGEMGMVSATPDSERSVMRSSSHQHKPQQYQHDTQSSSDASRDAAATEEGEDSTTSSTAAHQQHPPQGQQQHTHYSSGGGGGDGGGGGVSAGTVEEPGDDVWFDWIADIGDGFNSTYEMARLIAQPVLHVSDATKRIALHAHAGSTSLLAELWPSSLRGGWRGCGGGGREHSSGNSLHDRDEEDGNEGRLRHHRRRPHTPPATSMSPREQAGDIFNSPTSGRGGGGGEGDATLHPSSPAIADIGRAATTLDPGSATSLLSSPSANAPITSPNSASDTAFTGLSASAVNPQRQRYTDGMNYQLPRGSFVIVGGDLAYPNPNDDTFLSRFIGPYNDALRSNRKVQELYHERQEEMVEADEKDTDVAHIHMLDAMTVADIATGKGNPFRAEKGTVEEAMRTLPLFFAIPGNHEWLDGLSTYRKYILEKTWVGGWVLPQRTSYFVLRLPYNWFILCTDCGNEKDIDPGQRNYFLNVVEKYMDEESCVVLASHEPGWIYDAMLRRDKALQPELNRLAMALGTRLRMWLSGDIHHYSRHSPRNPTSEAPTLVVSGGGGAFLHGPRRSAVIHQGTEYVRAAAFPQSNTYRSLASRLIGFRLINWKFDLVVGACCFLVVLSMLPQPYGTASMEGIHDIADFAGAWATLTGTLVQYIFSKAIISFVAVLGFLSCFSSAGAETGVPLAVRLVHGTVWTALVVLSCCGMLAYLECVLAYMAEKGMLVSVQGKWGSVLDEEVRLTTDALLNHTRALIGEQTRPAQYIEALQRSFYGSDVVHYCSVLLRCLDPVETLAYLSVKVSSPGLKMGKIAPEATRLEAVLYYLNFIFFYWILVTPLVSFLIGCFLLVSATVLDCLYDPAYSAFQIEDYKHFVRFRLDARTRELHGYVVAEKKVPKVWVANRAHVDEACGANEGNSSDDSLNGRKGSGSPTAPAQQGMPPPHLRRFPSRWHSAELSTARAMARAEATAAAATAAGRGRPEVLEHFVCRPHSLDRGCDDAEVSSANAGSDAEG